MSNPSTPTLPRSSVSETELKVLVTKDGSERLRAEMLVGQSHFSKEEVEDMTRSTLIQYVTALRMCAGQSNAVKTGGPNFDPSKVALPQTQGASANPTPTPVDPTLMLMQFFKQQEQERREEQKRQEQREERLAQERKEEQERFIQEKKEEQERLIQERKEEQRRQEQKEERLIQEKKEDSRDWRRRNKRRGGYENGS